MALVSSALIARQGAKEASKISKKSLGFDFIPLLTSLILPSVIITFAFAEIYGSSQQFANWGIQINR